MNTNHAKAIKGMSIANIVLAALGIFGMLIAWAGLGVGGAAISGSDYDYFYTDDGLYFTTDDVSVLLGMLGFLVFLVIVCAVLILIAGILGVRGAAKPDKLRGIMIWNIVAAVVSLLSCCWVSLVLCIIVAVFANKDRALYAAAPAPAAPYGYAPAAAPVAPVAPQQPVQAAPVAPQQPAAPAPVAAAAPVAAEAVVTETVAAAPAEPVAAEAVTTKGADPVPAEPVAAVAEETVAEPVPAAVMETVEEDTFAPAETPEEAAEAAAEPAILLPDNYIEDAQAGVAVVEEIPSDADTAADDTAADDADNDKPTA